MAERAGSRGMNKIAQRWQEDARDADRRAQGIRRLIEGMSTPGERIDVKAAEGRQDAAARAGRTTSRRRKASNGRGTSKRQ